MTVNSAMFVDTSRACRAIGPVLSTVPGASFRRTAIAPESIASVFGSGLATTTAGATVLPLPSDIGGTRVTVTDAGGSSRPASLFYVSPNQVNILAPPGTQAGIAQVTITRTDSVSSQGAVQIAPVAPDLFAANATGEGVAAATAIRIGATGETALFPYSDASRRPRRACQHRSRYKAARFTSACMRPAFAAHRELQPASEALLHKCSTPDRNNNL